MSACVDDESFLKDEERRVLSEVHSRRGDSNTTTTFADSEDGVVISRYQYLVPAPSSVQVDDDGSKSSSSGDSESEGVILIRRRRKRLRHSHEVLTVVHKLATPVSLVGQQVWSAAFLLGDFILTHEELFAGANVLELGSGSGIAGLIAARVARQAFLTDYHDEILALLARNTEVNMHLIPDHNAVENTPKGEGESLWRRVEVRKLDWLVPPWTEGTHDKSDQQLQDAVMAADHRGKKTGPFNFKCGELKRLLSTETANDRAIIIASDTIYEEDLTEAFFRTLETLMSSPQRDKTSSESNNSNNQHTNNLTAGHIMKRNAQDQEETPSKIRTPKLAFHHETSDKGADILNEASPVLYLALEKRFNFSIEDMSVVATGYRALQRNVLDVTDGPITTSPCRQGRERSFKFEGMRIPLSFQQCFRYPRDENMEIWRIKLRRR